MLSPQQVPNNKLAIVLSGGGSRAAYQVGALKALSEHIQSEQDKVSIVVGSSIGAVNTVILGGCLHLGFKEAVRRLEAIWRERTFKNTFRGSPTYSFLKAIQVALLRYSAPGPVASSISIFDPSPLCESIDRALSDLTNSDAADESNRPFATAVMTTVEGEKRKPLLFVAGKEKIPEQVLRGANFVVSYVPRLTAAHGLASAALPSVLPPVKFDMELGEVHFVDGGISDNVPVDPALRLGASRVVTIDISGRRWWFDQYREPHDTKPTWEVPASEYTFCMYPTASLELMNNFGLGEVLKATAGRSTRDFLLALGPTWPIFKILKHKMGEQLAYEVMSYVALHPAYFEALIEVGYQETKTRLQSDYPISIRKGAPSGLAA